jgi:hypothetical protein
MTTTFNDSSTATKPTAVLNLLDHSLMRTAYPPAILRQYSNGLAEEIDAEFRSEAEITSLAEEPHILRPIPRRITVLTSNDQKMDPTPFLTTNQGHQFQQSTEIIQKLDAAQMIPNLFVNLANRRMSAPACLINNQIKRVKFVHLNSFKNVGTNSIGTKFGHSKFSNKFCIVSKNPWIFVIPTK